MERMPNCPHARGVLSLLFVSVLVVCKFIFYEGMAASESAIPFYYCLVADLNALYLGKDLVENTIITKEGWGGFLPTAKFINCE